MAIGVSTRISIRWPPAPASEPTDTLVISVNGYYVDLRVSKADQSIDWALAGQRIVVSEEPMRVKFTHPLDSHIQGTDESDEEPEPDVGDFTQLPNGDKLETGQMAAPHLNGQIMPYEEVWRSSESTINSASQDTNYTIPFAFVLESTDSPVDSGRSDSRDREEFDARHNSKTFYARAGGFFIGIRKRAVQTQTGTSSTFTFDAIRQDFDLTKRRWITKYVIGKTDDMWMLNDDTERISSYNYSNKNWAVNDEIQLGNSETYTIRAVADS